MHWLTEKSDVTTHTLQPFASKGTVVNVFGALLPLGSQETAAYVLTTAASSLLLLGIKKLLSVS